MPPPLRSSSPRRSTPASSNLIWVSSPRLWVLNFDHLSFSPRGARSSSRITSHQSPITAFLIATHQKTGIGVTCRKQRIAYDSDRNTFQGTSPNLAGLFLAPPAASAEALAVSRPPVEMNVIAHFSLLPQALFWSILPHRGPLRGLGQCFPSRSDNPFPTALRTYARAAVLHISNGGWAKP